MSRLEDDRAMPPLDVPGKVPGQRGALDVFEDPGSLALLEHLKRVALSEANLLILGENGCGQAFIAQRIHVEGPRRDRAFLAVNCGAFVPADLERELFGCERGALPGAFTTSAGWLEAAHGGTLFLDEVERLTLPLQLKLLRLLRDRQLHRIGGRRPVPADVRLVAASAVDLELAVRAGAFREDLFDALRAAHLEVPPLRQRRGDIVPLARHFLLEYRRRMGYPLIRLSPQAEAKLLAHDWPGNVRELENVIHHALLLCRGGVIASDQILLTSLPPRPAAPPGEASWRDLEAVLEQLCRHGGQDLFKRVEQTLVRAAYQHCGEHQIRAARLLGISRNVLRARLIESGQIDARK
ncbi:sigma 54-interacting transcriptional regulator [Aquabacterium sp. A7-Y]|uniref:sigma 54-interacting transcriptional regulator n=1 Tax=Aquabacterium sp. A7-Y TaxID=1349605 RepID=UPI00223CC9BB|nr:sigma 54-interacting transcriptional regulator [Aquabacterium sp. A7-Y]MCW7540154.1 sigma 54-interacting transcriptional regulator [Aquabacterium sp. A7-Y]